MNDPAALVALSSPSPSEAATDVIRSVLASRDPGAEIDRLYPMLLRHKTLEPALTNLERGGGDLDVLTVSAELFRTTWPLAALIPAPDERPAGRLPLSALRSRLGAHVARLDAILATLLDRAADRAGRAEPAGPLMAIFGRALGATYPAAAHRLGFDLDLFASDLAAGLPVLQDLRTGLGFALTRCRVSRGGTERRWRAVLQTFAIADGHELHVDLMIGGHPVGPGLVPLWFDAPLGERARRVELDGRPLLVPSAEDTLLLIALREQRKPAFTLRDLNDVRLVLDGERETLDWDRVIASTRRHEVAGVLHRLISEAEATAGRRLAPRDPLAGLEPNRTERRLLAMTAEGSGWWVLKRLWPAVWSFRYLRRGRGPAGAAFSLAEGRVRQTAFGLRLRLARSRRPGRRALTAVASWLRAGFGSLCEMRPAPAGPGGAFCLSRADTVRRGTIGAMDPEAIRVLTVFASNLPEPATQQRPRIRPGRDGPAVAVHRCRAYLFELGGP